MRRFSSPGASAHDETTAPRETTAPEVESPTTPAATETELRAELDAKNAQLVAYKKRFGRLANIELATKPKYYKEYLRTQNRNNSAQESLDRGNAHNALRKVLDFKRWKKLDTRIPEVNIRMIQFTSKYGPAGQEGKPLKVQAEYDRKYRIGCEAYFAFMSKQADKPADFDTKKKQFEEYVKNTPPLAF